MRSVLDGDACAWPPFRRSFRLQELFDCVSEQYDANGFTLEVHHTMQMIPVLKTISLASISRIQVTA